MLLRDRVAVELAQMAALQSSRALRSAHTGTDVVLQQVVEKLGEAGQRVNVSRGFARNHLVPGKLATLVPKEIVRRPPRSQVGSGKAGAAGPMTSASMLQLASVVDKLCSSPLELVRKPKMGSATRLATPITAGCIAKEVMRQRRVVLSPQLLDLDEPLVRLGRHEVPLRLTAPAGERVSLAISILSTRRSLSEQLAAAAQAFTPTSAPTPAA